MADFDKNAIYDEIAQIATPIIQRYGSRAAVVRALHSIGIKSATTYGAILAAAVNPSHRDAHGFPEGTMREVLDLLGKIPHDLPDGEIPRDERFKQTRGHNASQKRLRDRWIAEFEHLTGNQVTDFRFSVQDDRTVVLTLKQPPKIGETWITNDEEQAIVTYGGLAVITTGSNAGQQVRIGDGWRRAHNPKE